MEVDVTPEPGQPAPLPQTLEAAWQEWTRLYGRGAPTSGIATRRQRLARLILCELPARNTEELRYRILVMQEHLMHVEDEGLSRSATALLADVDRLLGQVPAGADSGGEPVTEAGHESATDRRQVVIGLLMDPETCQWSNREIARRIGVSPQTVGNWRNKLSGGADEATAPRRLIRRGNSAYEMDTRRIGRVEVEKRLPPPKPSGFVTLAQAIREYFDREADPDHLAQALRETSIATDARLRQWRDGSGQMQLLYPVSVVETCARRFSRVGGMPPR